MKTNLFITAITCLIISAVNFNRSVAATRNWIGFYSNNFSQANNWFENAVPVSGDNVQIGVTYAPIINNMPSLTAAGIKSIGSLSFGGNFLTLYGNIGISVGSGSTLNVTGDITFLADSYPTLLNTYNISGLGNIKAANMNINANYGVLGTLLNVQQKVNCSVNSLVLSGNLALTSESYKVAATYSETAYFNLTGGTTEIDGFIQTSNTIYSAGITRPASYVVINPASSAGATLQLNGANALSGLATSGVNNITFNNTYATVNYAGSTQTVYTTAAPYTAGGINYYNLTITGTGTETAGSATLNVSNNLTLAPTAAMTLNLDANTTISAIGNFTSNTMATLKQGSGQNFVVSGTAVNNGTINLVGNSTMVFNGASGLTNTGTINGLSGYTNQQNIVADNGTINNSGTINWYGIGGTYASIFRSAALINSGTINQLSLGTITITGAVNNSGTINKTNGIFVANAAYTNTATGVFTGTVANGSTSFSSFVGNYINNGTLTCNAEPVFYFADYTNNATFTAGTGMVYFTGATTETLLDNSTAGTIFNNVTFQSSVNATISAGTGNFGVSSTGTLYMAGTAQLTAGSTTVGGAGYLTIMSTMASTATVYIPSGTKIKGNVNVQRCLSSGAGTRGYRLLSSPVNISLNTAGAGNIGLSYLNATTSFGGNSFYGAFTQGPGTGFTTNGSYNPIIYLYDETRPTDNSSFVAGKNIGIYAITGSSGSPAYSLTTLGGKPAVTTPGINVPVGNSYLFYFVGNNQSTTVTPARVPDATTLTATGYLNQGDVPFVFWKTGSTNIPYDVTTGTTYYGINQVGNPYPATVNLNTLYSDNYNVTTNPIGAAFYELIPGGNYVSYNASNGHVSDSRASQYIVSGQGFLVQATASGQKLTFKEDQKVTYNAAATMLESFPSTPVLAHTLNSIPAVKGGIVTDALPASAVNTHSGNNAGLHLQLTKDSANYAQTGIYFINNASDKYTGQEDARQYDGGTPQVFLSSYSADSVKLSINTMADYGLGKKVKLYINAYSSGVYNMSLADITAIDTNNYNVYLIDHQKNDSLNLLRTKAYTFDLNTADTTSFGANRFELAIDHKPFAQYVLTAFTGAKIAAGVQLNWKSLNAGNYTGYTLQKLNVSGGYDSLYAIQSDTSLTAYSYIDTHPVIGNNTYRLAQNGLTGAITYSAAVTIGYNTSAPDGVLTLYPNPAKTTMNVTVASNSVNSPAYVADIYNSMGARVSHQTVTATNWTSNVSSYKPGIYLMQIKDMNGNIISRAKFARVQ